MERLPLDCMLLLFSVGLFTRRGKSQSSNLCQGPVQFREGPDTGSVCRVTICFLPWRTGACKVGSIERLIFRPSHQPFTEHLLRAEHCGEYAKKQDIIPPCIGLRLAREEKPHSHLHL